MADEGPLAQLEIQKPLAKPNPHLAVVAAAADAAA
eukprot:CAMPEP_0172887910 /NCGR_PEP_ID=MMETSP1075-20121228/135170_1 /TAXON_ID=2916 /ORGANISM="Ceratium fusus, Strain PA161109" /LENGTH=34 /DNA_ID= /DNA_START= /DNA_END= /DNA_ORIENTATION=